MAGQRRRVRRRISIHALREEGDEAIVAEAIKSIKISIHALREEGDFLLLMVLTSFMVFLSTPSARRATDSCRLHERKGTISIHALREEGDRYRFHPNHLLSHFYPRPPRGGRRCEHLRGRSYVEFLSTPSARRATPNTSTYDSSCNDFYPRPPRGGRPL